MAEEIHLFVTSVQPENVNALKLTRLKRPKCEYCHGHSLTSTPATDGRNYSGSRRDDVHSELTSPVQDRGRGPSGKHV